MKKIVFIVDDDAIVARAIKRMLSGMTGFGQCEVHVVEDPSIVAGMAQAQPAAKIFLVTDTDMPQMMGYDLIRKMRAEAGDRLHSAVLMSGNEAYAVRAPSLGADLFMHKPASDEDWASLKRLFEQFAAR